MAFPFFNLPVELQAQVFGHLMPTPAVHYCTIKVARKRKDPDRWVLSFARRGSNKDDSAYKERLAATCDASALVARGTNPIRLPFSRSPPQIAGGRDLLVFNHVAGLTDDSLGSANEIWHPTDPSTRLSIAERNQLLAGFQKIGLMSGTRKEEWMVNWWPVQLAWFIDACPDIREFYLIFEKYDFRANTAPYLLHDFSHWVRRRPSNITRFFGTERTFTEIHSDRQLDMTKYTTPSHSFFSLSINEQCLQDVPCTCSSSPRCSEVPIGINPHTSLMHILLLETRVILMNDNPGWTWRHSRSERKNIKLGVLLQYKE